MSILPRIDPEFRSLIPSLSPDEREQLEQNIATSRKCYDPIILWEGVIIDGHNRFEICAKYGVEFQIEELPLTSREEAKVWILENQLGRRNLTDVTRIEMALLKAEMLREKAQKNLSLGGKKGGGKPLSVMTKPEMKPVHVQKAIAAEAGVGEEKLYNYMQIKEHGSPQLLEQVQSGELKIGTAHRLLTKEILKQLNHVDKILRYIEDCKPAEGYKAADPEIHSRLINLSNLYRALLDKLGGDHEAA